MGAPLARRNLLHDKVRFAVTLSGIAFSIVLITLMFGLLIGFTTTTSGVIDHGGADIWIAARGVPNFDTAPPILERTLYRAREVEGVLRAESMIVQFSTWKAADGASETIEVVGFNIDQDLGRPWDLVEGRVEDLKLEDTVIIDELYKKKLGIRRVGDTAEINDRRARVVGFTRGIRSFTTSPYVFTSYRNSQKYTRRLQDGETVYVLVRVAPGADPADVKARLAANLPDVRVFTTGEFSRLTQVYWMFTTGAGTALLIAAVVGLIVGVVVVAQTIYATTMDRIREFGTLKAMGASNRFVYGIILRQAALSAVIGYAVGMAISIVPVTLSRTSSAAIRLPWWLAVGMFVLTLLMCGVASVTSINKVTHVDPAMVFKG